MRNSVTGGLISVENFQYQLSPHITGSLESIREDGDPVLRKARLDMRILLEQPEDDNPQKPMHLVADDIAFQVVRNVRQSIERDEMPEKLAEARENGIRAAIEWLQYVDAGLATELDHDLAVLDGKIPGPMLRPPHENHITPQWPTLEGRK